MSESGLEEVKVGVTWRHIVVTALATGVSFVLAYYAVIAAPVGVFPGVSGLYLAAAIYVPLSLWLGMWGCFAGYFSCLILGFVTGYGWWSFLWALCDFFEAFLPLVAFRLSKTDVDIGVDLKKPKYLYLLLGLVIINLIIAAIATPLVTSLIWQGIWITTVIIAIILVILMYVLNPSRSWLIYVIFGIFGASFISALIGVPITQMLFVPGQAFWIGFIGWFAGDLIVLSAIATPIMVGLTSKIKQTSIFVENWFS